MCGYVGDGKEGLTPVFGYFFDVYANVGGADNFEEELGR